MIRRHWVIGTIISISFIAGIYSQYKYDPVFLVIYAENRWFHKERYSYYMVLNQLDDTPHIYELKIKTRVEFSFHPQYIAEINLPEEYLVLNNRELIMNSKIPGYKSFQYPINTKRYRDLEGDINLLISSKARDIEKRSIIFKLLKDNKAIYKDEGFSLRSDNSKIILNRDQYL